MTAVRRLVGTTVMLLGLALPSTGAADVPDAECPGPPTGAGGAMAPGRIAQTFTVVQSGVLTRAELAINKFAATGDYTMTLSGTDGSGTPNNTALASVAIPDASVPMAPPTNIISVTFPNPPQVVAGQTYALVLSRAGGNVAVGLRGGDPCPGGMYESASATGPFTVFGVGMSDAVFRVFVEPAAIAIPDTVPPDTTITAGPKAKTKKKTATFAFSGTDARAVAGFMCSLDGGAFASCASPHTVKVKKGKHTFAVRAVDDAGNTDASVATYAWKVKRRKRR